jgi:hypothetical protein
VISHRREQRIGERLGLDVDHIEDVVRRAIDGAQAAMRETP